MMMNLYNEYTTKRFPNFQMILKLNNSKTNVDRRIKQKICLPGVLVEVCRFFR